MFSLTFILVLVLISTLTFALPLPHAQSRSPFAHHARSAKRDDPQKYVVAHFMMGNTFPYTTEDFEADIKLAHESGIDGFALNIGSDVWQPDHVRSAYQAAANSGTDFKLFISFDMTVLPCGSASDAETLRNYVTEFASHPNQFRYEGRVFASTFAGENCQFGQGSTAQGWKSQFIQHPDLQGQNAVYFVPSFFVDPATFNQFNDVMDGALNWNSAWPITLTTDLANNILSKQGLGLSDLAGNAVEAASQALGKFVTDMTSDQQYNNGLSSVVAQGKKAYMATISPWFFTHYGPDSFNKNFVYYGDSHLYPSRWESVINDRNNVDLIELLTWNDYGESHYIAPVKGDQPNSQAWVDGFAHDGWLDMTKYYATAFKTGSFPDVTEDKLYMWARPHPKDADAPDGVGKPTNFAIFEDTLWAVVFATKASMVTLGTTDGTTSVFEVPAGVTKLSVPLTPGGYMHGRIVRDGQAIVDLKPENYTFEANPKTYNYNAFVAFASANSTQA
ncbi:hypothetical protein NLI96_g4080 [Meripilus lineatus]|uniref:Glycoside hydrolase family 71 protein n=1 Tax=Meripilus lineatus TaxID=2056292 RepID=A0AAD5YKF7_9APHY|nr:hypothetical protein NLI96_g4080 [Physisporinus lineatus]